MQSVITRRSFAAFERDPDHRLCRQPQQGAHRRVQGLQRRNFGYAFRLESVAYRDKVEAVIECLKAEGWLAKLYEKWYGTVPEKGTVDRCRLSRLRRAGFQNYDPTPHAPACK